MILCTKCEIWYVTKIGFPCQVNLCSIVQSKITQKHPMNTSGMSQVARRYLGGSCAKEMLWITVVNGSILRCDQRGIFLVSSVLHVAASAAALWSFGSAMNVEANTAPTCTKSTTLNEYGSWHLFVASKKLKHILRQYKLSQGNVKEIL